MKALDHQLRLRETALTTAEHRVELLRTRLENDASTTQKAAQAVEAERVVLQVPDCTPARLHSLVSMQCTVLRSCMVHADMLGGFPPCSRQACA